MAPVVSQQHVVFMNMAATGHMNPTLPMVARLVAQGCRVTYFVEETMRAVVEAVGASWLPFRYPHNSFTGILRNPSDFEQLHEEELKNIGVPAGTPLSRVAFPASLLYNAQLVLPLLLDDLGKLSPPVTAIVYEPFLACGRAAAHALDVPCVGFLTMAGPGVLGEVSEALVKAEGEPWVERPRRWIQGRYGIDLLRNGALMEFYSPVQNLVTTIDELYMPPKMEHQVRRFGHIPFLCVGALLDARVERIQNAGDGVTAPILSSTVEAEADVEFAADFCSSSVPLSRIRELKAEGRRVLLVSLGTVVTQRFSQLPLKPALNNDRRPEGARSLTEYTGMEFCQLVYAACFEAVADDPSILAIFAMGSHGQDALKGLREPPANVVLRETVPQLQLLPLCDAFITHGGCNSMHEALAAAVPLCVIPAFGDQVSNADTIARAGAGVSFRDPLVTLSGEKLRASLQGMLGASAAEPNEFKANAMLLSKKLAAVGGVDRATDAVLAAIAKAEERTGPQIGGA